MSSVRRLFAYIIRYRGAFLVGLLCVVATTSISLATPMVLRYAVDDLTRAVTQAKLIWYGALLLIIGVLGGLFRFLMRRVLIGASRHIEYDMRNDFFAHLERLPVSYFQAHRTGDLMSRATNDLNAVRMVIGPSIMYSANTLLVFTVALVLMLSIDARLTLVALVPLPFVSIAVRYFGSAIEKRFERIQAQLSDLSAVVQEALSGVRVVRSYRQETTELERFQRSNAEYVRRNRTLIAIQGLFFPSLSFFLGVGALLVLWLGSRDVIQGRITVGQFVAFNAYLTMLSWPMIAFGWVTNMLQRGMASWKRILEVLDAPPAVPDSAAPLASGPDSILETLGSARVVDSDESAIRGEIEFRDLAFGWDGRAALEHVSFHVPAGQTVALVGATGSGKSTLVNLLARLHEPPRGSVFIDHADVRDMPLATVRGTIGFVPQEPFLFGDTLANNIAFGMDVMLEGAPGAGRAGEAGVAGEADGASTGRMERIRAAAAVARLDKDVADFPGGYDTVVGERGITLSGGQKQRTALARAIAVEPRILVLDDAMSSVDTYTEEEILTRLREFRRGRTAIIVSHRISTVRDADQIVVLDSGHIAERGTHDELIRLDGLYADLHKKQLLEEELAAS